MAHEKPSEDLLYFNGVNGATGAYGLPPMTGDALSRVLRGESPPENLQELQWRRQQTKHARHFGVKEGVDPKNLEETGWGVIFAHDADPGIRDALAPLLDLRREQAGDRFKVCDKSQGYRRGESKAKFLARWKVGPGPVDPNKLPYYLLLVGSPEAIPYRFQSQLDVQYAVGRIHFETPEEYAHYAQSVVTAEGERFALPRKVSFFGVENPLDQATQLSTRHLIKPLGKSLNSGRSDWGFETLLKKDATKGELGRLLGGDNTPALLFTASHGMEFPNGDPRQLPHQGALLCSDWPGPVAWRKPIPQDFYFAGDDLDSSANLLGLVGFFFACYGAGTPELDEFSKAAFQDERQSIAPHPFLAALPSSMLSHPGGGALAVVGHVERAWGCSFSWPGAGSQIEVFESTLERLLGGHPIGSAMEYFDERYAELSTVLADELEEIEFGAEPDPYELSSLWTANNDARGYAIIGDPAVRLQVAETGGEPVERPTIEVRRAVQTPSVSPGSDAGAGSKDSTAQEDLPDCAGDLTKFTVSTYASADPASAEGARLQVRTQIDLTGDTEVYVHEDSLAPGTLEAHESAVREALAARLAYLRRLSGGE